MLTWLRRLVAPAPTPAQSRSSLQLRVSELEERVDFLEGALKKLRGRVTGAERQKKDVEDPPGQEISPEPPPRHVGNRAQLRSLRGF